MIQQISSTAKSVIDSDADIFYSDVSLWEIAIKVNIGKLNLTGTIPEIEQECVNLGLDKLRISSKYFECLRTPPLIHRDPFDRLIISQAMIEGLPLISSDHDILSPMASRSRAGMKVRPSTVTEYSTNSSSSVFPSFSINLK